MASYSVIYKPSVEKDLRSLSQSTVTRVIKQVDSLRDNPISRSSVKLTGSKGLYRIRVGDYRVIYGVDQYAKQVTVHYVRHRRDVYR